MFNVKSHRQNVRIFPEVQVGMEAAAVFLIAGLGYVVTRLSENPKEHPPQEGFADTMRFPTFNTLMATAPLPSEPTPEQIQGQYINAVFPDADSVPNPTPAALNPSIETVMMNQGGVEQDPSYGTVVTDEQGRRVYKDYTFSELMGQNIKSSEFKHNNMTPFFGGRGDTPDKQKGGRNDVRLRARPLRQPFRHGIQQRFRPESYK